MAKYSAAVNRTLLNTLYNTKTVKSRKTKKRNEWKPQSWQKDAYYDRTSKVILLTGSAGGGKSALACAKAHKVCKTYPGAFVLAVRKTRESMTSSTALFLQSQIIKDEARHLEAKSEFRYPNGSILKYSGMNSEKERERIRSIGLKGGVDFIICDEANQLVEKDYEELTARLRANALGWRQIVLCTNPDDPNHWINRRLIEKNEATVVYSSAIHNQYVDEDYRDMLNKLSGVLYDRLALGKWVSAEGLVYSNWNPKHNLINGFGLPDEWRRIGSIDFGFENPTVAQWWAIDNDNRMYMYREIYQKELLAVDLANMIKSLSRDEEAKGIHTHWVADHAADARATLRRAGIVTKKASKRVDDGINVVNDRLRLQGDGKPGIMYFKGALVAVDRKLEKNYLPTCTIEEYTGYIWDKKADDTITDKPKKINDHGMDATRYAAVEVHKPKLSLYG